MNQPFGQRAHRRLLTIRGGRISTTGIGFLVGVTPAAVHLARAAPSGVWLRAGCAILGGLLGAGVQGWGTTSACPMPSPFARAVRVALAGLAARASAALARGRAAQPDGEPARTQAAKAAVATDAEHGRRAAQPPADHDADLLRVARGLVHRLHAQDRHRAETVALVAYRLHDPVDAIAGLAATLLDHRQELPAQAVRDLLAAIVLHARTAGELADRLAANAHHHRTQPTVAPESGVIDAAQALRHAGELAAFTAPGCPVTVDTPGRLLVRADAAAVDRVLALVVDNAVKYAPGGPVRLAAAERGPWAVLAVEDRGPGIPARERERIFDQFTRLAPATRTPGVGLGLYLARSLARAQGGELVAVDPLGAGVGARFELRLPAPGSG